MTIKILQYNVQSLKKNKATLEYLLNKDGFDICCLCETFSHEDVNKNNKIFNFNLAEKRRGDGYGGVAIGLRKYISFKTLDFVTDLDIVIVKTLNLKKNFVFCAVYCPPSISVPAFELEMSTLLNYLETLNDVVLLGDFNARCLAWGDSVTMPKGRILQQLTDNAGFICFNNGAHTFKRSLADDNGTVLDLCFANGASEMEWSTLSFLIGGSHHFPIEITIKSDRISYGKFVAKNLLADALSRTSFGPDMDEIEKSFLNEINSATFKIKDNRVPKFWWQKNLDVLFRSQKAAFKKCERYPTLENIEAASTARKEWKLAVLNAKRESFKANLAGLNADPGTKQAWNFVKNVVGRRKIGATSSWNAENNEAYLKFLKEQVPCDDDVAVMDLVCPRAVKFEYEDFERVLNGKRKASAGGCDGITYDMIKALPDISKSVLFTALNNCFANNLIRDGWRRIKIVPVPKPGKDLKDYRNFRPISLIAVFLKMINLMVKDKVACFLEAMGFLPERCFAYRRGRSTSSCVNDLLHRTAVLKANGFKVMIVALDIANAYNCVKIEVLSKILVDCGLEMHYIAWIRNFLSNRILCLGKSTTTVVDGLPQGSCLSPLLFNVYTKNLHGIEDWSSLVYQYADDFLIMVFDKDFNEAEKKLQTKVQAFYDLCKELNLSFQADKSQIMYLAKGSRKKVSLSVNGAVIQQVKTLKYLGRTITASLSVKDHYTRIAKEVESRKNVFKFLTPVKGGLDPAVALNLYRSLIRSKLEYARATAAHTPMSINKKIMTTQNATLRRCLGVTPSTPIHVIYALANEMPAAERSLWLTARELLRVKSMNPDLYAMVAENPYVRSSYSHVYHMFQEIFDVISVVEEECRPVSLTVRSSIVCGDRANVAKEIFQKMYCKEIAEYKDDGFVVFATDASVKAGSAGCAVFNATRDQRFLFRIQGKTSSLFSELIALLKAVEIAVEDGCCEFVVFTDSLNACKLLSAPRTKNHLVAGIFRKLNFSNINKCHIVWAPAHVGIKINETADWLAKYAADIGAPVNFDYTLEEGLRRIKDEIYDIWNRDYRLKSTEKGRKFFELFPDIPSRPWFLGADLEPAEKKILNRMFTGHTYDKTYLHRFNPGLSCFCDICGCRESVGHMIFECPKYRSLRSRFSIFSKYTNLKDLLECKQVPEYKCLLCFIQEAKIDV